MLDRLPKSPQKKVSKALIDLLMSISEWMYKWFSIWSLHFIRWDENVILLNILLGVLSCDGWITIECDIEMLELIWNHSRISFDVKKNDWLMLAYNIAKGLPFHSRSESLKSSESHHGAAGDFILPSIVVHGSSNDKMTSPSRSLSDSKLKGKKFGKKGMYFSQCFHFSNYCGFWSLDRRLFKLNYSQRS